MKTTRPFARIGAPNARPALLAAVAVALLARRAPADSFFVNDGSRSNDVYCAAAGSDTNDGRTASSPVASLATILQRYTLTNGPDTVYIDSGVYTSATNIVVGAQHAGTGESPLTIVGAGRTTVLSRSSQNAGDCCLKNLANHVVFTNLTLTGGDAGLVIDSSSCMRAEVRGNTFFNNGGAGLVIAPSTNPAPGYFKIDHNLFYGGKNGLVLEPQTSSAGSTFYVYNNTVSVTNGTAVIMGGNIGYSSLRNNLLAAENGSLCLEAFSTYGLPQSDFNNFWTPGSGAVCRLTMNGVPATFGTLAPWQRHTQASFTFARDAHSFCRDPLFASPATGDFHLMSKSGRWQPLAGSPTGGVWVADSSWHSPCIDAADPYAYAECLPAEPDPNGGRLNIGAFGGSAEASQTTPGRQLLALAPDLGQKTGTVQMISWNASGLGWEANETLQLNYSLDAGQTWTFIDTCFFSQSGSYEWARPANTFGSTNGCWVSVTCAADTNVTDAAFLPNAPATTPTVFYVNDGDRSGDRWCVAPGNSSYDGLGSNTPLDSVQAVISRYHPGIGATIYVDAGTYNLYEDLQLPDTGAGGGPSNNWFRLVGADRRTLLKRQYGYTGSCCVRVRQDFARIEGVVCQGGETGVIIDPSSCRNAALVNNTIAENTGYGIRVLPDPNSGGFDTYEIKNNLLYNNGGGLNLQSGQGFHLASFTVQNNTISTYNSAGIACGGSTRGTTLKNNIIAAKGTGFCLSVDVADSIGSSDYNDLYAYSGAGVARAVTNNAYTAFASLGEWQAASGADASSMSRDPLFVSTVNGDFHLRSNGGSWHGGAWLADTATSPCIDAGSPSSDFAGEPAPNGGRINMGAYGGTSEASHSAPNRILVLLYPRGGETLSNILTVAWSAFGSGWKSNDTVRIEYATSTNSWTVLSAAASLSPTGTFNWQLPNPSVASLGFFLRVVCNQDPLVYDATKAAFSVLRRSFQYYVNDANTNGDWYCAAPGADNNPGTSPTQPIASLSELLKKIRLGPGDTVFVDAGSYPLSSNIVIDSTHKGAPDAFIRIVGTRGGSVLTRNSNGSDRKCLEVHADFIRIEGLTCEGSQTAQTGIAVNASSARHALLLGNTVRNSTAFGIAVKPFGMLPGEEYQLLQNTVVNNGAGLYLEGATNLVDNRCLFLVENNTVLNGGTGVKVVNANSFGKRINLLKNNIIETTNAQAACLLALPGTLYYSDFNNLRPATNGFAGAWISGTGSTTTFPSLAEWRAACGQEAHSLSADPQFVAPASGNFRLKVSSPCVDAGINSFWMFNASDADGKPRVAGKGVDMGAYELFVKTSVRLFLQGPYLLTESQMSASLWSAGLIPTRSPYAEDPRTAAAIPANVTDWVLVQFRSETNGPALFSRSVFLRKDGWLVTDAGSPNLDVDLPANEALYLVVKHRNHLPVMSAQPLLLTNQLFSYDFTAASNACFGAGAGCVSVNSTNGVRWALGAGDTDGDGAVLPVDLAIHNSVTNAGTAYLRSDANLDGSVAPVDNARIVGNLGLATAVPRPETILRPALWISPARQTLAPGESVTLTGGTTGDPDSTSSGGLSVPESLSWDFVRNRSFGTLQSVGSLQSLFSAGTATGRTDIVEAWTSNEYLGRAYLNVVGAEAAATAGKALIIAGRLSSGDTLWPTTDYLADNAYTTLRYRGFTKENIHYLSPEPGQDVDGNGILDDIDGESTFAQAASAFTNTAAGASRLFVYLVDHGGNSSGNGYFRLNASETITAAQLDAWLDSLQDASGAHVTVLLDFCYAGSFLQAMTYNGAATRIVIAACGTNQPSYFVAGGLVSFSGAFFTGVMLGYDIRQCFETAESAMSTYQAALLDDDKDGAFSASDGALANGAYIGPSYVAAGDAPLIGEVCGNQILTEETAATLWIGGVSSVHPVSNAWCQIVPPGHDPDPDSPVTALPQLTLTYDEDSGRYSVTYDGFTSPGTYSVLFYVQDEEGNVSAPRTTYVAQIGYDDRAILVAGADTNSAAWPAVDYLTRLAYQTLRLRLFTPDHIHVLSPAPTADFDGDGTNDVNGAASLTNLYAAISQWATTQSTDRLTLILLGEGATNTFCLSRADSLTTNQLATWVHNFQATNPVPVNLILDFSGAGAFLPALADAQLAADSPDATRISLASARAGRDALFSNGGTVSFSQYLFSGILSGETLGDAYTAARRAIRRVSGNTRQQAQIDDTLDGVASEKDIDGLLADVTYLGSAFITGADAPLIGAVVPPGVLATPGSPYTIWAGSVTGMHPVSNVWCVVTPPNFDGSSDLPTLSLTWNASTERYECVTSDFLLAGSYGLTFYAQDSAGQVSDPVQSEVILADAFEDDSDLAAASLYDGTPQIHTFHASEDVDWVRLYLVTNFIYDIETYHLSERLDTVIDFYQEGPDGSLTLLDHVDEEGSDEGEYTGIDYPATGWYWARLAPFSGGTNTLGTYEFSVSIPAAEGLNSLIVLGLDDVYASALPTGSTVTVDGQGVKSFNGAASVVYSGLTNGTYLVTVPVPTNFIPREDPSAPNQVQSLTNLYYANPRRVAVAGGWRMAGFEMLSTVAVTSGVVRDAWTHAFLDDAQIAFAASSGSLTGSVVSGGVMLTSYGTNWLSAGGGKLPGSIVLGACNWNLSVSLSGYQPCAQAGAVSNVQAGAKLSLGTAYLVPLDANANQVADAWESAFFPGGMDPDADSDGDGLDNRSEYLSGTDPTNALSVLRFVSVQAATNAATLNWTVSGGRSYRVLAATSLVSLACVVTNGPWEAAHGQETMQWSDIGTPLNNVRFYRIDLSVP